MFRAKTMIEAFEKYSPELVEPVQAAFGDLKQDLDFLRLDPEAWKRCNEVSIDYAIMERADNLVAVPFAAGWSDLGGWDAVLEGMDRDTQGVAFTKNAHSIDCKYATSLGKSIS